MGLNLEEVVSIRQLVPQERPSLLGREYQMDVNRGEGLWHSVVGGKDATPSELGPRRDGTQGSSLLATLGWRAESLRDSSAARSRIEPLAASPPCRYALKRGIKETRALAQKNSSCARQSRACDSILRKLRLGAKFGSSV